VQIREGFRFPDMTYGLRNILGIVRVHKGEQPLDALVFSTKDWPAWLVSLYGWLIYCHAAHLFDFAVALTCWLWLFPLTFPDAKEWHLNWVLKVVAFNLTCEFVFYTFWHHMTYAGSYARGPLKKRKYNQQNQYEESGIVGYLRSSSGNLQREVFLTTLGFLQSSLYQCVVMWLWASGRVPYYADFWSRPVVSIGGLVFATYWREFHFYWVHRAMHPWWKREYGLAQGDIGAVLYRYVHSWHHRSYNPGPWSGLSMHPVEHLLYYTCTLFALFYRSHPLHFLYTKFHADIAPIGGHDGFADPCGDAGYHWLHHAKYEVNYGVPLIPFDWLFGTWLDHSEYLRRRGDNAAVPGTVSRSGSKSPDANKAE